MVGAGVVRVVVVGVGRLGMFRVEVGSDLFMHLYSHIFLLVYLQLLRINSADFMGILIDY